MGDWDGKTGGAIVGGLKSLEIISFFLDLYLVLYFCMCEL